MLVGGEHRELIREYFRFRRRGQLVLDALPGEMLGRLVRDNYLPDEGSAVVALLPDWVQWCADQAGLPATLAAAAMKAARVEAANPVTDDHGPGDEDGDGAPFRRQEL